MPRGRPRKIPLVEEPPATSIKEIIAREIAKGCSVPGCSARWHLDDAAAIIESLKEGDFYIVKTQTS